MKTKSLLLAMFIATSAAVSADNLIANGDFETDMSANLANDNKFSFVDDTMNVVLRVQNYTDAQIQILQPTVDAAKDVEKGVWYKKASNWGYVKAAILKNTDVGAAGNCLMLMAGQNSGTAAYTKFWSFSVFQKISTDLDITKKYKVTFKAKAGDFVPDRNNDACKDVSVMLSNGKAGLEGAWSVIPDSITLSPKDDWTTYTAEFNLPAAAPINGENALLAFSIRTEMGLNDNPAKTKQSAILLDDVVLEEVAPNSVENASKFAFQCIGAEGAIQLRGELAGKKAAVYNSTGVNVSETELSDSQANIQVSTPGIYFVRIANGVEKVIVK